MIKNEKNKKAQMEEYRKVIIVPDLIKCKKEKTHRKTKKEKRKMTNRMVYQESSYVKKERKKERRQFFGGMINTQKLTKQKVKFSKP